MRDFLYLTLYRLFSFIIKVLPTTLRKRLIHGLAWVVYSVSKKHQKRIEKNLELAFPNRYSTKEKRAIGKSAFANLIDTLFGIMQRHTIPKEEVLECVTFSGEEIIESYLKENKQFILITGHFGNWELLSQAISLRFNLPLAAVGRKLDSKAMDRLLRENRERFGIEMIDKRGAMKGCIKAINQNKIVGVLVDQSIRKNYSIDVEFFNQKTTHTPLVSILSRRFGLDIVPIFMSTEDFENYHLSILEPIKSLKTESQEKDLAILTQQQAAVMEKVIKGNPPLWFWMHNRWK
jgi:KDO2-lipid IV(A) lauroyltransferase